MMRRAVFHNVGFQPFPEKVRPHAVMHPWLEESPEPLVVHVVEEALDVEVGCLDPRSGPSNLARLLPGLGGRLGAAGSRTNT